MGLAKNFTAETGGAKKTSINWEAPTSINTTDDELILTKTKTHFPMELHNDVHPDKATDSRPIEIYRGKTIVGTDEGSISVSGDTLTDTSANFPTTPSLKGRLLRSKGSTTFRILDNTATTVTVDLNGNTLVDGKYIILPDFPNKTRNQENYEVDIRTTAGPGSIANLVISDEGSLVVKVFELDELTNLIFIDSDGNRFLIKTNTENIISFFETDTPVIGPGMTILNSHTDSQPLPFVDTFLNEEEADSREGSGLESNTPYYYTMFTKPEDANVAQAEFGEVNSGTPTQAVAMSPDEKQFGDKLYSLWPSVFKELDNSGDLEDLMQVFGSFFDELHAYVDTFKLQDSDRLLVTALLPLAEQTGLPSVGLSIGADTLRRIAKDMLSCWKIKGSKEGIALFIRKITTWDITNGTGDFSSSIQDAIPNVSALRFFDTNLGSANTRLTQTDPIVVSGGRFAKGLPGIIIPGFFIFREFVITIPNVALFIGSSTVFTVENNETTMIDTTANFGPINGLVGNFLLPNQEEVNDIFKIVKNTATSITVRGIITNRNIGGNYVVLSPLNTNRFIILNKLLPYYIPFGTSPGFQFV